MSRIRNIVVVIAIKDLSMTKIKNESIPLYLKPEFVILGTEESQIILES